MSFSAYLVGSFERRFGIGTTFQIINPTTESLQVVVAVFDSNENFQACMRKQLSANDMLEIVMPKEFPRLAPTFGVVKVISHIESVVKAGIVGYQRHVLATTATPPEIAFSETVMAAIPQPDIAQREYDKIRGLCP